MGHDRVGGGGDGLLRLRSVREGRLLAGPEVLQINLGNACNLNCVFCWNHSPLSPRRGPAWHAERLSDRHVDGLLADLQRLRPGRVQLSGRGEPLLHPRARAILAALRDVGCPVTVQTNGVGGLTVDALVDLDVDHLAVNVSAGTEAGYERTHPGRGGLFRVVVERLEALAVARRAGRAPRVTLVGVIQRSNADEIVALADLAVRVGAAAVHVKGLEPSEGLGSLALDAAEAARALGDAATARERAERAGVEWREEHLGRVAPSGARGGRFSDDLARGPCFMGWYYLRVTSDGRLMFCCKDKEVGHLDRGGAWCAWRSAPYHLQRLAGRDGDTSTGLFDGKCRTCSNFERNLQIASALARGH